MTGKLTIDQKQVLEEIPGYIRIGSLYKWMNKMFNGRYLTEERKLGVQCALIQLKIDIDNGDV